MLIMNVLLAYVLEGIFPYSVIWRKLQQRLGLNEWFFLPTFSGRVAIHKLSMYCSARGCSTALLPEYICDVVPKAVKAAGLDVRHVKQKDDFTLDCDDALRKLPERGAAFVLFAPMYGSCGGLSRLKGSLLLEAMRERDVMLVADLCQDLSWIDHVAALQVDTKVMVGSFNCKQIPGEMGGFLASSRHIVSASRRRLTVRGNLILRLRAIRGLICQPLREFLRTRATRNGYTDQNRFESSECKVFPFWFDDCVPSKYQLALALAGLYSVNRYRDRQRTFARASELELMGESVYASYVLLKGDETFGRKLKPPYAVDGFPDRSARPELRIIHNKGYLDR